MDDDYVADPTPDQVALARRHAFGRNHPASNLVNQLRAPASVKSFDWVKHLPEPVPTAFKFAKASEKVASTAFGGRKPGFLLKHVGRKHTTQATTSRR